MSIIFDLPSSLSLNFHQNFSLSTVADYGGQSSSESMVSPLFLSLLEVWFYNLSWKVLCLSRCSVPVNNSIIIPETLQLWKNTRTFSSSCLSRCVFLIWYTYTAYEFLFLLFLWISISVLLWDTVTQSWISVFNRSQKNAVDWWGERWWRNFLLTVKHFKIMLRGMVQNWVQ